ncbi:MAG: transketolase [Candidatus Scatomorpha sp.]
MPVELITNLQQRANELKKTALTMIYEAQSGHPGGSFSAAEIISVLYFSEMKIDPENPNWEDRDRFVLSKGHACPIQYAALGHSGYFAEEHLHTLRKEGSILQGHPDMKKCPGIDISTGSLGQGVSCAVGMAIGAKMQKKDFRVFCLAGDGEMNEGIVWEAMMSANKYRLDNFILIMDNNGLQIDGTCNQVMPLLDMSEKARAFGFEVYDIDGHDIEQILKALDEIRVAKNGKPKFINAKTIKGKGVDYMENKAEWHGAAPNAQQYADAMAQLDGRV